MKAPFSSQSLRRFPGSIAAYNALLEVVDVEVLADAAQWIGLHPEAANTSYNCSNGDIFRWSDVCTMLTLLFFLNIYNHKEKHPYCISKIQRSDELGGCK